jgi:hypothetical protein
MCKAMDESQVQYDSQLFSIRLWPEDLGDGRAEWRGQVRHLASGEARYFRQWRVLVAFMHEMLPKLDGAVDAAELDTARSGVG